MKILHISELHSLAAGGTTIAVDTLSTELTKNSIQNMIFCSGLSPMPPYDGVSIESSRTESSFGGKRWHYDLGLRDHLKATINAFSPDIVHIHGYWMAPQLFAAQIARKNNIPTVLSVHGSLFFRRWQSNRHISFHKKALYSKLIAAPVFKHINLIHAITAQEHSLLQDVFTTNRIITIPNSIDPSLSTKQNPTPDKRFGYIGRISPEKNLGALIRGFCIARLPSDWQLFIIGPCANNIYLNELKKLAGPENHRIHFTGALYGKEKQKLVRTLHTATIPSLTEVIGMVNLECAMEGIPTITTHETGLDNWQNAGGLKTNADSLAIANALETAANWSLTERNRRGKRLSQYVKDNFGSKPVTKQWINAYRSIIL